MATFQRRAVSTWSGDLKSGKGTTSAESGAFNKLKVNFAARFVNEENQNQTNPEELVAAAHASCYNMALSNTLAGEGNPPEKLDTRATVTLSAVDGGFKVSRIHLETEGVVPGVDEAKFAECAETARKNCPMSVLLEPGVEEVTLEAKLVS